MKEYLKSRNMTISQLCEKSGVSRQTIYNLMRQKHIPRTDTICLIAKALDIPTTQVETLLH